jgi:low affinity Fe/Cu permease
MVATVSGNTVAVIALGVTALVGFGSPLIQGHLARKRQKEALDAARAELETRLRTESERLAQTLAVDHRKTQYEAEREVLDACAAFIQRFRVFAGRKAATEVEIEALGTELGGHLARLRLWFDDETEIVQSFESMVSACAAYATGSPQLTENDERTVAMEEEITKARNRYLNAAREHLRSA